MMDDGVTQFYHGIVENEDGAACIFINEACLQAFAEAQAVHVDGTFWSVPNQFIQMGSLHAIAYGYVSCYFL